MAAAIATSIITSPELDVGQHFDFLRTNDLTFDLPYVMPVITLALVCITLYGIFTTKASDTEECSSRIPAALSGVVAAGGLVLSQMVYPSVVIGFLDLSGLARSDWDPTLMFVMGGGVSVSFIAYQFVPGYAVLTDCPKMDKPFAGSKYGIPTNTMIDWQLILGAFFFGTGWGISGLCPGPALLLTMKGLSGMILLWWPLFYVGNRIAEVIKDRFPVKTCNCESSKPEVSDHNTHEMRNDGEISADFHGQDSSDEEQPSL